MTNINGEYVWQQRVAEAIETVEREPVTLICDCCQEAVNQSDAVRGRVYGRYGDSSLGWICEECQRTCAYCDNYFANQQVNWYSRNCPACQEAIDEEENNRDDDCDHDECGFYYPSTKFFGQGPKYFGLEIETEVNGDRCDKLYALRRILGDYAALKDDGSLDYGIEIATQPASMSEHKTRLARLFANVPKGVTSWKHRSCGLHIHVSRKPLSDLAIAKTVCFISANHNRRFIRLIAGRESMSYCKIQPKKMGSAAKYNDDRYEAVNLQNDNTIEFRLFKGTLRQASVFKCLEFTDALTAYASTAARSIRDSQSRVQFCGFVAENSKTWPNLSAFIEARWFGRETDLTKAIGFEASENQEANDQTSEQ
jgi:Putative amidoligase enzyme